MVKASSQTDGHLGKRLLMASAGALACLLGAPGAKAATWCYEYVMVPPSYAWQAETVAVPARVSARYARAYEWQPESMTYTPIEVRTVYQRVIVRPAHAAWVATSNPSVCGEGRDRPFRATVAAVRHRAPAPSTVAYEPTSSRVLTGGQIRAALVGNTITGVEDGQHYEEYLKPSGAIAGQNASGPYTGEWQIAGNRICFLYAYSQDEDQDETKHKGWDCNPVTLKGSRISWSDDEEDPPEAVLLPGNPRML